VSRPFDLIVFDCDGVLVDSEPISNEVLAGLLTAAGVPTTTEESLERYMGGSMGAVVADAERRLGGRLPDGLIEDYYARCAAAFDARLTAVPGIEAALDALGPIAICVASSGRHAKIRHSLGLTGLLPRFDGRIFSAHDVARGKPEPDLFLHAAARMGADPARCAVIEDAPVGIAAALAAGMAPFGYTGRTPPERLAREGVRVFSAMRELPGLLSAS
jgi:HAD superfamily hydrolase (TIGR01509 family)